MACWGISSQFSRGISLYWSYKYINFILFLKPSMPTPPSLVAVWPVELKHWRLLSLFNSVQSGTAVGFGFSLNSRELFYRRFKAPYNVQISLHSMSFLWGTAQVWNNKTVVSSGASFINNKARSSCVLYQWHNKQMFPFLVYLIFVQFI